MESKRIIDEISVIIKEAGAILKNAAQSRPVGMAKEGHANFVTQYDEQIQAFLMERLALVLPEAKFIGEEDGASVFTEEDRSGYAFVIDPIDGTSNFMKGYGVSVISIGLLKEGVPAIGVIYNPFQDCLFTAAKGMGAFLNGEPIHSSNDDLANSLVSFGTGPYYPELHARTFELGGKYLRAGIDLRRSGTAAWDLCNVAWGKTGLFFEVVLNLWDFAAGAVIAEEAGCVMTDLEGKPLTYDGPSSILCASQGVARGIYLPDELN